MSTKNKLYVSEGYIEQVNHLLYNNLPLHTLYVDDGPQVDKKFLKQILLKDEQWRSIEHYEHIVITSLCRFINTYTKTIYAIGLYRSVNFYIQGQKIDAKKLFEKYDWHFDFSQILQRYKKNKWKYYSNDKVGTLK